MKMLWIKTICFIGIVGFLTGCGGMFKGSYFDRTGGLALAELQTLFEITSEPRLVNGNYDQLLADNVRMMEDGYYNLGHSNFKSTSVNWNNAIIQAKNVHATTVIVYSKFLKTEQGFNTITTTEPETTFSTFSGSTYSSRSSIPLPYESVLKDTNENIFGSPPSTGSGIQTFSGSKTETTYKTKTEYVPYSVDKYHYMASYWVKYKPNILPFGTHTENLTPELRQKIGRNKGVNVFASVKGSPAYNANIITGDILLTINGHELEDQKDYQRVVKYHAGQVVDVEIWRNGSVLKKQVKLNEFTSTGNK